MIQLLELIILVKIMILFFIIPIIIIILFLVCFKEHYKNIPNEKKYNTNLTKYTEISTLPYTNKTQENISDYLKLFNEVSKGQKEVKLEDRVDIWTYNDISENEKEQLNSILLPVLEKLNKLGNQEFVLYNYEGCQVNKVKGMPYTSYIIDFNVWELKKQMGLRLRTQIIIDIDNCKEKNLGDLNVAEMTTPEFKRYYNGYPSFNQWIPVPIMVIPTGNEANGTGVGVSYKKPCKYYHLALNWIEIFNSNLTLRAEDRYVENGIGGVEEGTLEYTRVHGVHTPYIEPYQKRNPWIKLNTQPPNIKAWPCTPNPKTWGFLGVPDEMPKMTPDCPGRRTALKQQPLTVSEDPSMFNNPRNRDMYHWMFALETGGSGGISRNFPQ